MLLWNGLYELIKAGSSAVTALLLVGAAMASAACSGDDTTRVVADGMEEIEADNVVYGMTQLLTNEGVREGRIEADTAYFFRDSSAVHLRRLTLTLFDEDGGTRATVTGDRGRLDSGSNSMVGRGGVVLTVPGQGREILTEELHYSSVQDQIWSDSSTVMRQNGEVQCGSAFRSDLEFQNVFVENMRTVGCGG